jgi:hypothetical protein
MEPKALAWNWPVFTPTTDVDPSALRGTVRAKEKSEPVPLETFVDRCIGAWDPCSKRSVRYEARQQYDCPERRADDLLELALDRGLVAPR